MSIARRTVIASLAIGLAACKRGEGRFGGRHGPLDTALLDRKFGAIAARATPGIFTAGVMNLAYAAQSWFWNGPKSQPMADFSTLPLAAAALAEVDAGRLGLGERIKFGEMDLSAPFSAIDLAWPTPPQHHASQMPAVDLISLAVQQGDHTAADVILRRIGGPGAVTAWLEQKGFTEIRLDRYAREITQDIAGMAPFRPDWKDEAAWIAARDTVPAPARETAMNAYVADPRDTASARAAVGFVDQLALGELISRKSTNLLLTLMATSRTGANRFAAGLPGGATIAQKASETATDLGFTPAVNDVAVVTFKDGRRALMAGFLAGSTATQADRDRLFADAAKLFVEALG